MARLQVHQINITTTTVSISSDFFPHILPQWMIDMACMTHGDADVASALTKGPTSGVVQAFIDGTGPTCLFIAKYNPPTDGESPRGGEAVALTQPTIVAHTGLSNGGSHASIGMADSGRMCYFTRAGPSVNKDIAQDLNVLFGEFRGDPAACIASLLNHVTKPVCEALGPTGKSSKGHLLDFVKSLDRLTQELHETSAAMKVRQFFFRKCPSTQCDTQCLVPLYHLVILSSLLLVFLSSFCF